MIPHRWIVGLLALALIAGCARPPAPAPEPGNGQNPPTQTEQPVSEAEARAALKAHLDAKGPSTSNPRRFQYAIAGGERVDQGWKFSATEFQRYTGQAWSLVEKSIYLVRRQSGKLVVERSSSVTAQATAKDDEIDLEIDGNKNPVIKLGSLPKMFRPYGADESIEFGVGKSGWGALAISPDLKSIAFVTRGTHAFFGVVNVASKAVQGLDLWYGGGPGELAWSPDGKWMATTVAAPSGGIGLYVWNMQTASRVNFKELNMGPEAQFANPRWEGGKLLVEQNGKTWTLVPETGEVSIPK